METGAIPLFSTFLGLIIGLLMLAVRCAIISLTPVARS
jgi:hypothetical protein